MKKILLIIIAVTTIQFFNSCSKEDNGSTPSSGSTSGKLVGNWKYQSMEQKNGKMYLEGQLFSTYSQTSKDMDGAMEFKSDGTWSSLVGYTAIMVVTTAGIPQNSENPIPKTPSSCTYVHNPSNNTISMTTPDGDLVYSVLELTSSKLVMKAAIDRETNTGGISSRTTSDSYITLIK